MNSKPWDVSGGARNALRGIVGDPQYGAAALSQPAVMTNLLKDMLPDEPREAGLLVAAAQADLAGSLRGYVTQGLDAATAVNLTATSFVNSTSHTKEASDWVVGEIALALGLNAGPAAPPAPTAMAAPPAPTAMAAPPAPTAMAAPPPSVSPWPGAPNVAYNPAQPQYRPAAPGPWQPTPWTVPPRPPASGGSVAAGVCGLLGAVLVLIACFVPVLSYPGSPGYGILLGHRGLPVSETFWIASEPIGVLLIAIAAGIALIVPGNRPRAKATMHGMLMAFGIQTVLLFAGYAFVVYPPAKHGGGGYLGILGGLALLTGGLIGLARGSQSQPAAGTPQAAAAVRPGPAGG